MVTKVLENASEARSRPKSKRVIRIVVLFMVFLSFRNDACGMNMRIKERVQGVKGTRGRGVKLQF
jgi:hypothetical protein